MEGNVVCDVNISLGRDSNIQYCAQENWENNVRGRAQISCDACGHRHRSMFLAFLPTTSVFSLLVELLYPLHFCYVELETLTGFSAIQFPQ